MVWVSLQAAFWILSKLGIQRSAIEGDDNGGEASPEPNMNGDISGDDNGQVEGNESGKLTKDEEDTTSPSETSLMKMSEGLSNPGMDVKSSAEIEEKDA